MGAGEGWLGASSAQQLSEDEWPSRTGGYRVSADARAEADRVAQRVRGAAPRLVTAADARGRAITLVQIGRFTTHDSARRFATQLGGTAVVVPVSR